MKLALTPCTITEARAFVERHHSHHHAPQGALFAVGVSTCGCAGSCSDACDESPSYSLECVATVGRPNAPRTDAIPTACEVTRVASTGQKNAASMCLAAATRMALAGGYRRLVSFTLLGEAGTTYLAAGWVITGLSDGRDGWHNRAGRSTAQHGGKVRWETGPDALPADGAAALVAGLCVGRVAIPARVETLPLLRAAEGAQ